MSDARGAGGMNWSDYSAVYDLMATNNPAYQELLSKTMTVLQRSVTDPRTILDLGAGTGNFSIPLAMRFPRSNVLHVEPDEGMKRRTVEKVQAGRLENLRVIQLDVDQFASAPSSIDLTVCIHSLYTFPNPKVTIQRAFDWTQPGGFLFACDFGRVMDLDDWRRFFWRTWKARMGVFKAARLMIRGRAVASANRRIASLQKSGHYWTHDLPSFLEPFSAAGFQILEAYSCYRGYSNALLCRKPAQA